MFASAVSISTTSVLTYLSMHHHFIYFFFYCYGDHRDLHSFPTRRSSDLISAARRWRRCSWPGPTAGTPARLPGDRKSTRLNSSHRCISYAVFCLKKKNKQVPVADHDETRICRSSGMLRTRQIEHAVVTS